jgi:site-specific recombinase XerC
MSTAIIAYKEPPSLAGLAANLPAVFLTNEKARDRFFGFFTANIRNKNTWRAYYKAACRFSEWCEGREMRELADVTPPHVAAYIEWLGPVGGQRLSKPSVKQHLAALRMLFDWLVICHVIEHNPAHAVRGPKYSQKKGKTPVLDRDEARALIGGIDTGSLTGLRDRALIGVIVALVAILRKYFRIIWRNRRHPGPITRLSRAASTTAFETMCRSLTRRTRSI